MFLQFVTVSGSRSYDFFHATQVLDHLFRMHMQQQVEHPV